jgi:hypothetical protein
VVPPPFIAFAAEFPNDNWDLHTGTIWMCERVCGPAEAHPPAERTLGEVEAPVGTDATAASASDDTDEPIEIVESIVLEGPIELVPAPLESGLLESGFVASAPEPEGEEGDVPARLVSTPPPPIEDAFEAFLQTLSDVACESGHTFAASEIGAALASDPVASAWRAILNGESEDFSLCGTPLDEWASLVLARVVAAPHKAANLRRELRARGVAAFGLVEVAA